MELPVIGIAAVEGSVSEADSMSDDDELSVMSLSDPNGSSGCASNGSAAVGTVGAWAASGSAPLSTSVRSCSSPGRYAQSSGTV